LTGKDWLRYAAIAEVRFLVNNRMWLSISCKVYSWS